MYITMMSFVHRVLSIALLLQFYSQFAWAFSLCYETLDCGGILMQSTASLPNGEPRCCIEGFRAYQGSGVEGCIPCRAMAPPPTTMMSTSAEDSITTAAHTAAATTTAHTTAHTSDTDDVSSTASVPSTAGMPSTTQVGNVGEISGVSIGSCQAGCIAGVVLGTVFGMLIMVGGTAAIIIAAFHVIAKNQPKT